MARATEIHLPTVAPGINPGGIWIRECTATELLTERPLHLATAELRGFQDGELAGAAIDRGEDVRLYIYDGDSGQCMGTLIASAREATKGKR